MTTWGPVVTVVCPTRASGSPTTMLEYDAVAVLFDEAGVRR